MKSVGVVGAGITGLTAAFRLRQRGVPVTIYESSPRVGGVIRSVRENGFLAECGPNSILETSPKIGALIDDLGLAARRLEASPASNNRFVVRGGKPILTPSSPGSALATPLLSALGKLRVLAEPFVAPANGDADESVAEFVVRRLGREFFDYAIDPMVAGIFAGNPAKLSMEHALPKMYALERNYGSLTRGAVLGARQRKRRRGVTMRASKKVSFDDGLEVLPERLGQMLHESLRLGARIVELEETVCGWKLAVLENGGVHTEEHSAIIYTAPAHTLPEIRLRTSWETDASALREIRYTPVASVVLGFRRDQVAHSLDGFGMLLPAAEKRNILGTLFSSSLFPGRAPAGHVAVTTYVGGGRSPELASLPAEELVRLTLEDLRPLLGIHGSPTFQHVFAYPKAIAQYEVGYSRFKSLFTEMESHAPGLRFAGHFRNGISIGDCILAGEEAASRVADMQPFPEPGVA